MRFFWDSLLLLSSGLLGVAGVLVARCPTQDSDEPSYCRCSDASIAIRCDFKGKEDVVLTKDLLTPYNHLNDTAYIQTVNASTMIVRSDFVERWLQVSSAAFDIWHSGVVTLNAAPRRVNNGTRLRSFAGIGIINCTIPEVPAGFLRDRARGAFRIKDSTVGVIRAGFIDNVKEMRYIVLEDSSVEEVEGSVAAEGYVTLSQLTVHSWNGLVINNVTVGQLGPGAFNLTHKSDKEVLSVNGCHMGHVSTGAFSAAGDINVTIRNNIFDSLDREAFRVNVTGSVYVNGNLMGASGLDALGALRCHDSSSIQNNTIQVSEPFRPTLNRSATLLQPSCGKPQLFLVLTPLMEAVVVEDARAAWVLGGALAVLVLAWAVGVVWIFRRSRPVLSKRRFLMLHKGHGHSASLENLPRNIELSIPHEDPEEGTSVEDLDMEYSRSQQDAEALQFDADGEEEAAAAQSDFTSTH